MELSEIMYLVGKFIQTGTDLMMNVISSLKCFTFADTFLSAEMLKLPF